MVLFLTVSLTRLPVDRALFLPRPNNRGFGFPPALNAKAVGRQDSHDFAVRLKHAHGHTLAPPQRPPHPALNVRCRSRKRPSVRGGKARGLEILIWVKREAYIFLR